MSVNMSSFFIILLFFIIGSCEARPEDQKVNDGKVEPRDEENLNVEAPTKENSIIEPNVHFFEGDIALPINSSSNQLGGVQGTYVINDAKIWPQGAVPFKIDTTSIVAKEHQDLIRQGLKELEEVATCLQFTEVTGELVGDVLLFRSHGDKIYPGKGCWSYIGRMGGTQVINLEPPECMDLEHIKHEVLHSLGAIHEHSRPDRDKHIRILEENVLRGSLQNFKISQWSYDDDVAGVENFGAPYDLYSIMHYPNNAFGINNSHTIEAVNPKITNVGSSGDLTLTDIIKLNLLNQCEIDSNTIVDYLHEMVIKDDYDLTADILKTVEDKNDKLEEDSKNLQDKVEAQERRIEELEISNIDYKAKLDLLIWDMEKMRHSLSILEQNIDMNVEVVQDKLESHEIESKEILSRLEARASQELLLEDTVENIEDTVEDLSLMKVTVENLENTMENLSLIKDTVEDLSLMKDTVEDLSLMKDTVEDLSLMKDTVEDLEDTVEDLSSMNLKRTCQEYADSGIKRSGYFWLDPDGPLNPPNQIRVWCNITAESGVTEVLHDSEITTNITHCPQPGCYTRNVTYESSRSQIRALMEISEHCSQDIRYDCTMAPMKIQFDNIDYAFWVGDNGKKNTHWDDFGNGTSSGDHFCACHSKSQCFRSNIDKNKCNCDSRMASGKFDEGTITDIDILPVRQLRFGGLQFNFQSAQHTLGRLKCTGSKPVEIGSSCEALRIAGNYLSGYYNVKEGDQGVRLVFCNMTINPWDDEGLETFEESVAEEIEAVHTNFSTQLDHLEMAVNKTIQNVETTLRKMPGPPGKQGQKGNQGHVGPKGIKGDVGLVGKVGFKGDKGNVGLQGINGPKGDKGEIGQKGIRGMAGHSGPKGNRGAIGLTGNFGPKGDKGEIGTKGDKGNIGMGSKGIKGDLGLVGKVGPKGDKGNVGLQGINGPKGDKGEIGQNGIRGMTGISGLKGNKGAVGLTGNSGPKGDKGEIGTKGEKGSKGIKNLDHLAEMSGMKSLLLKLEKHHQPSVCNSYSTLTDAWRHIDYVNRGPFPTHCDKTGSTSLDLGTLWYRFEGAAGTQLPTGPAPVGGGPTSSKRICGSNRAAHIASGGHPTIQDGIVSRDLCFEFSTTSCAYKGTVKVAACRDMNGDYFVYQLQPVPMCSCAYCAID